MKAVWSSTFKICKWFFVALAIAGVVITANPTVYPQENASSATMISTFQLTAAERLHLQRVGTLRIGLPYATSPYERLDSEGQWKGFAADLLQPLFKRAGVDIELILLTDSLFPYKAVSESQVDLMVAVPIGNAPTGVGLLTRPYDNIEWGLVEPASRNETRANAIPSLAMVGWSTRTESEITLGGKRYLRQPVTNINEALSRVYDGRSNYAFVNVEGAHSLIEQHFIGQLQLNELSPPYFEEIGFMVAKEQPELLALLNRYLDALDQKELPRLRNKWHVIRATPGYEMREIATIAVPTLVLLLLIISTLITINRRVRAAHEEAKAADRAKSVFLSTMSHEIRTPMNGVLGVLDILSRTPLNAEQSRWIHVATQAAQTLLKVIDDALDYAKIEAGRLPIELSAVTLREELKNVIDLFQAAADEKKLSLRLTIAPAFEAPVVGDALRLRQIVGNLLSNAIRFTQKGEVWVQVVPADLPGMLKLSVVDTGIGVPSEIQPKLFSPFEQGDSSTTRRFGGTGLGLAIVKRLSEAMGGSVSLTSTFGVGTTVSLQLPWTPAAPAVATPAPVTLLETEPVAIAKGEPQTAILKKPRILLVEDNALNREIISRQLAISGFETDFAIDGEAGLSEWQRLRPPILLLDCHLPKLDGYGVSRRIREIEQKMGLRPTVIIAVSANALAGDAEKCLAAGMDDHLAKPLSAAKLKACLEKWLSLLNL